MATQAQITANQMNAKVSTGPRSEPGKAASSQNSLRHGLRSQSILIPGEDPAEYQALRDSVIQYYGPQTRGESAHIEIMVTATWRLLRVPRLEAAIFNQCEDPAEAFIVHAKAFTNLVRYQTAAQKAYDHAKKELLTLISFRLNAQKQEPKPEIGFARQNGEALPPAEPQTPPQHFPEIRT